MPLHMTLHREPLCCCVHILTDNALFIYARSLLLWYGMRERGYSVERDFGSLAGMRMVVSRMQVCLSALLTPPTYNNTHAHYFTALHRRMGGRRVMISWSFMGDEDCCYGGGGYLAGRRDAQPGNAQVSLSLPPLRQLRSRLCLQSGPRLIME